MALFLISLLHQELLLGGKTSNDIFIMISAWFLADRKCEGFVDKSVVKLFIKTTIFSIGGYGVYCLFIGKFDFGSFITSVQWVNSSYGFIVVYLFLFLLYPLLNKLISCAQERILQRICLIGLVFITLFRGPYNTYFTFIFIYLMISYIKKYKFTYIKKEWCVYSFVVCSIVIKLIQVVCQLYFPSGMTSMLDEECDILVLINALSVFIFVAKSEPFYNNIVNFIAKGMITVYLIHENSWLRFYIWSFFRCEAFYDSNYMIIHNIFCSCVIMILGVIIGFVYDIVEYSIIKKISEKIK